mmetsp:Transcript_109243/g.250674  ORF Transcript_109243/g.250674 Transcript_109243/m.250674 type:complete len:259 (+) Transcript_109243:443-1219(+)
MSPESPTTLVFVTARSMYGSMHRSGRLISSSGLQIGSSSSSSGSMSSQIDASSVLHDLIFGETGDVVDVGDPASSSSSCPRAEFGSTLLPTKCTSRNSIRISRRVSARRIFRATEVASPSTANKVISLTTKIIRSMCPSWRTERVTARRVWVWPSLTTLSLAPSETPFTCRRRIRCISTGLSASNSSKEGSRTGFVSGSPSSKNNIIARSLRSSKLVTTSTWTSPSLRAHLTASIWWRCTSAAPPVSLKRSQAPGLYG